MQRSQYVIKNASGLARGENDAGRQIKRAVRKLAGRQNTIAIGVRNLWFRAANQRILARLNGQRLTQRSALRFDERLELRILGDKFCGFHVASRAGIEPATFGFGDRRSTG